jgi:hypothetical protein
MNVSVHIGDAFASERKKATEFHPAVEEVCEHLAKQRFARGDKLEPLKFSDGGFSRLAVTKEDFARFLPAQKRALSEQMAAEPRNDGESLDEYVKRLQLRANVWRVSFWMIAEAGAHIMRIEREEADAAHDAEEERKANEARQREELERGASPDRERIRALLRKIEGAAEGEMLINQLAAAIERHRIAEAAREELTRIFEDERRACARLGRRSPSRPAVPQAPHGVIEFATTVARANAPPPRVYHNGDVKAKSSLRGF